MSDPATTPETPEDPVEAPSTPPFKTYAGQAFFDVLGRLVEEVGAYNNTTASKTKIATCKKALQGRWCFSLLKTMIQRRQNGAEEWMNVIVFPDGTTRKLVESEYEKGIAEGRHGQWLTFEDVARACPTVKSVPQVTMPWAGGTAHLKLERFTNMEGLAQFVMGVETSLLFYAANGLPPENAGLYAYLAITEK